MRLFGRRVADRLYQCYHAVVGQRHRCGKLVAVDHGPYDCRERFGGTEEIDVLCNESRIGVCGGDEFVGCLARDELFAAYVYYVYRRVGYEGLRASKRSQILFRDKAQTMLGGIVTVESTLHGHI